jgi:hypothetical protein
MRWRSLSERAAGGVGWVDAGGRRRGRNEPPEWRRVKQSVRRRRWAEGTLDARAHRLRHRRSAAPSLSRIRRRRERQSVRARGDASTFDCEGASGGRSCADRVVQFWLRLPSVAAGRAMCIGRWIGSLEATRALQTARHWISVRCWEEEWGKILRERDKMREEGQKQQN